MGKGLFSRGGGGGEGEKGTQYSIHTNKTCLNLTSFNKMKINRKLKDRISHRAQVSSDVCFHCAKFEGHKHQLATFIKKTILKRLKNSLFNLF